jgi:hypothetical protein
MTPKEKAIELVDKFTSYSNPYWIGPIVNKGPHYSEDEKIRTSKQCALIAVEEILDNFGNMTDDKQHYCPYATIKFYEQVKQEIEKL